MTALRIALRYLFSKKSHRAINVISVVAMAGVAVATMAIVIVLAVFDGFTELAAGHLAQVNAEVRLAPKEGKTLAADSLAGVLRDRADVAEAAAVLQERALLVADNGRQMPVVLKGLDYSRAGAIADIEGMVIDGVFRPDGGLGDSITGIQPAVGVAINTGLRPSPYAAAKIYEPRRRGRINPANPAAAYRQLPVAVTGVIEVNQPEYDADFVFMPLEGVRRLLDYRRGEGSAVEVKAAPGVSPTTLCRRLAADYPELAVEGRMEQQADTFRMIAVEKWVTFLMLCFILVVAAFNIVSTLSLMVIEKRSDMATLRALGAPQGLPRSIFAWEGALITFIGGGAGTVLGVILALVQQHFGIIKLDADPSALTIDVYPVSLHWGDVGAVLLAIAATGAVIALISRLFTRSASMYATENQ